MAKTQTTSHKKDTSGHAEGSYRSYTTGFALSIVATLVPYFAFQMHILGNGYLMYIAVGAALVQLFVQLVLFLHLGFAHRSRTNLIIFIYALVLVITVVAGTLWIMSNLNTNMVQHAFQNDIYSPQTEED